MNEEIEGIQGIEEVGSLDEDTDELAVAQEPGSEAAKSANREWITDQVMKRRDDFLFGIIANILRDPQTHNMTAQEITDYILRGLKQEDLEQVVATYVARQMTRT